jgi:tetratricopeptide (TPR) repeat protein
MLYMQGQYENALSAIGQCIANDSVDYKLFLLQGNIQENLYQYDRAAASYNRALLLNGDNREIKSSLAALYTKIGRVDISADLYGQLAESEPEVLHWKMKTATALQSLGKPQQALSFLRDAVLKDSLNWVVQRDIGDCYYRLSHFDSAALHYRKSLDSYPNNKSFVQLMRAKIKNKEYIEAIKTGREAVGVDSTNVEAWKQMGLAYCFVNMHRNAITVFDKAVALGDTSYLTCSHLGVLYYPEDYASGIKYLEIALRHEPQDLTIMYYLSIAYELGGEVEKSLNMIDRINMNIKPYDSIRMKAEMQRGVVYLNQRRYNEALKLYLSFVKSNPSQIDFYLTVANIYSNLRKKKEALDWYIRYINKRDPDWETTVYEEFSPLRSIKERINKLRTDVFFEEGDKK